MEGGEGSLVGSAGPSCEAVATVHAVFPVLFRTTRQSKGSARLKSSVPCDLTTNLNL